VITSLPLPNPMGEIGEAYGAPSKRRVRDAGMGGLVQ
jgi:hypothetical protein